MSKYEPVDDSKVALPVRFKRAETEAARMRRIVRELMSQEAVDQGFESFEDADDFDVGDDYDPTSPYEMDFDQEMYNGEETTGDVQTISDDQSQESGGVQGTPSAGDAGMAGSPPPEKGG